MLFIFRLMPLMISRYFFAADCHAAFAAADYFFATPPLMLFAADDAYAIAYAFSAARRQRFIFTPLFHPFSIIADYCHAPFR